VLSLREAGGDFEEVEVKSAAGGFPESLTSTLSAMANLPGGGLILLGLDETTGFRPVVLKDAQALKQALATRLVRLNHPFVSRSATPMSMAIGSSHPSTASVPT